MPRVRDDDAAESEEWKKRQIPVVEPALINGQMGKLLTYARVFKSLGIEPILAMLFLGWLFGFWQIPVVDKYFNTMIADDLLILKKLDELQRSNEASQQDRLRITRNLFQAFRIACENSARAAKDENARNNCGNIHE